MSNPVIIHTIQILDKEGKEVVSVTSSKDIPDYDDFEKSGFRAAFHELEGAIIETSQEVNKEAAEHYLSKGSKKNSSKRKAYSPPKAVK